MMTALLSAHTRHAVGASAIAAALLAPTLLQQAALAQCPAAWRLGTGTSGVAGASNSVRVLKALPDGSVLVGGYFALAGDAPANNIARFDTLTGHFSALGGGGNNGANSYVLALAAHPSGDVYVGGSFSTVGGISSNRVARYSPATDSWSSIGGFVGFGNTSPTVNAVTVLNDGNVLFGGSFSTPIPTSGNLALFQPGTGTWAGINPSVDGGVNALLTLPSGDVLVGGGFDHAGGISTQRLARYNPTTGVWTALGPILSSVQISSTHVDSLTLLPGGDVIVQGAFAGAGASGAGPNIARLNPTTGEFSSLGTVPFANLTAVTVTSAGEVVAAGSKAGSYHIGQFDPATSTWTTGSSSPGAVVNALIQQPGGGPVIVGGEFSAPGGVGANRVARYDLGNDAWSSLVPGTSGLVVDLAVLPGGDVLLGGTLYSAGGVPVSGLARFTPGTGGWTNPGSLAGAANSTASALLTLPNGDVIVGGRFGSAGGVLASNIARYTPSTGAWAPLGTGTDNAVYSLGLLPSGDIVVGGGFLNAGGLPAARIAKYSPATGLWSAIGSSTNPVRGIVVLPNGDFIIRGDPLTGITTLSRYNQSSGLWTPVGSGFTERATTMCLLPSGNVLFAASYINGGSLANRMKSYNPTTDSWTLLGAGPTAYVWEMLPLPDGTVILGGTFDTPFSRIARFDPATGFLTSLSSGPSDVVNALAQLPSGDLVVGGAFALAGGQPSSLFARYSFGSACRVDFDCSGATNVQDIFSYLGAWFAGNPAADFDGAGGITVSDLFQFLNAWFTGC